MASKKHLWQCIYCGKQFPKYSTQENPSPPMVTGYCSSNPSGNKKAKCVIKKIN